MGYLVENAKMYHGAAGAIFKDLAEISNVKDVTLFVAESGEADVTTRASGGWRETVPTLRELSVDFEMEGKSGDAAFDAIRAASLTCSTLELAIVDQGRATSDAQSFKGTFSITSFSQMVSVSAVSAELMSAAPAELSTLNKRFIVP